MSPTYIVEAVVRDRGRPEREELDCVTMAASKHQAMRSCLLRWRLSTGKVETFSVSPFSTASSSAAADADELTPWLVKLEAARLGYPNSNSSSHPLDLTIQPATFGGHAVLGRNGTGKSLLAQALAHGAFLDGPDYSHLLGGELYHSDGRASVARVSFESHEDLLARGGSTYTALTPFGGLLSKAAQFLVVRFGLFPLLHRDIATLSTGEIRKVLFIRALSTRPNLLILDNAFDGLDAPSRQSLAELVSMTLKGFRADILVQGVNAKNAAHTQVLLSTHRPEEIVDEISTVTFIGHDRVSTERRNGRTGEVLFQAAIGHFELKHDPWDDAALPSLNEISNLWTNGRQGRKSEGALFEARNLRVSRGEKDLISELDWTVQQGECWVLAGGNGAGKSSISRLLAKPDTRQVVDNGVLHVGLERNDVGWVSTEVHMSLSRSTQTARDVLLETETPSALCPEVGKRIAEWLGLRNRQLSRPFAELSQGEQKLVLIGRAISKRPKLLIIDEPLQGLDLYHRRRVLGLVESICRATDTSLIYVTHHLEELIPSVENVLHLKEGKSIFKGPLSSYDPETL